MQGKHYGAGPTRKEPAGEAAPCSTKTNIAAIEVFGLYTDAKVETLGYILVLNCGGPILTAARVGQGMGCVFGLSVDTAGRLRSTVGPLVLPSPQVWSWKETRGAKI